MSQNAIELRGLKKTYGSDKKSDSKIALSGIDLDIPRGTIFGLLGPNGAGKSTLINILAGLVKKSSGSVKIWGFDQDENPRQSRAAIGVMPQELNLDPFFTPGASLDMQAGLYGIPRSQRKTHEILRLIGLEDKANSYSRNLSGGMRRRLLLGKALVHSPQILVLDEPTAGVDIALRQMLWNNVRQLNLDGITVILTTHYLEEAQEMCDQIAIMHKGEIRALDTTANLLSKLDTKTLVVRTDTSAKINLPDGVSLINRSDGNMAFSYSRNSTSPSEILDALRAANIRIIDIQTEQPDLQDVFLDITK
jgi:ABC-2 type transport system ATP-binding protein